MGRLSRYQETLLRRLEGARTYGRLRGLVAANDNKVIVSGLRAGAASLAFARLAADFPQRPILYIAATNDQADALSDDFAFFGVERAFHYPRWETLPYDLEEPIGEIAAQQAEALAALAAWEGRNCTTKDTKDGKDRLKAGLPTSSPSTPSTSSIPSTSSSAPGAKDRLKAGLPTGGEGAPRIVAAVEALLRRVLSNDDFRRRAIDCRWGDKIRLDTLAARLADLGYERVTMVETRGEFSIRGNIVDVFPLEADNPYRLDLFGDEIESIRLFDAQTQRSLRDGPELERVQFLPARLNWLYNQAASGSECDLQVVGDSGASIRPE
ncbi:MAG: hypothetical protein NTW86_26335, partial [Candidatus Sumerlaeota bacterium]|nr:hypothetical protein [Candidatus Sumerlaeota bacterium]